MSEPDERNGKDGATPVGGGFVCPAAHAGWLSTPLRRLIHNPERILEGIVQPGQTAADFGCGPGFFTLPLARMAGPAGRVIAVDLQPAMLERLRVRAERAGLLERIVLHRCEADTIGELPADGGLDAALVCWMVHEVPDPARFLAEVAALLRPAGRLLLVEPKGHVSAAAFAATEELAAACGLRPVARPHVRMSRAVLLEKV